MCVCVCMCAVQEKLFRQQFAEHAQEKLKVAASSRARDAKESILLDLTETQQKLSDAVSAVPRVHVAPFCVRIHINLHACAHRKQCTHTHTLSFTCLQGRATQVTAAGDYCRPQGQCQSHRGGAHVCTNHQSEPVRKSPQSRCVTREVLQHVVRCMCGCSCAWWEWACVLVALLTYVVSPSPMKPERQVLTMGKQNSEIPSTSTTKAHETHEETNALARGTQPGRAIR